MTDTPKPPEGYDNWLDFLLNEFRNGFSTPVMIANQELAVIRAQAAAYREAMKVIKWTEERPCCPDRLRKFMYEEEAAGRWQP